MKIESVSLGPVSSNGRRLSDKSGQDFFILRTLCRNDDNKVVVTYRSWQSDFVPMDERISLTDDKGTRYQAFHPTREPPPAEKPRRSIVFRLPDGFASIDGRARSVDLKCSDEPVADILVFESKAAQAEVLYLELPVQNSQQWVLNRKTGTYRFRIPRSAREREK